MGELERGQEVEVIKVKTDSVSFSRRLASLGLFTGAKVRCLFKGGGVSCYDILGAKIALRAASLNDILVVVLEESSCSSVGGKLRKRP